MEMRDNGTLRRCTRCLYDETVFNIEFDADGVCNLCRQCDELEQLYPLGPDADRRLKELVDQIKYEGRKKPYDCIIGVSGGCDSSYLLYKAKELGLRPLAAHFDNTWNSKISTENIHNVLKALDIDLYTLVVDNEEYDDIYRAFLEAGLPDMDSATDIGSITTLYKAAAKYGIKYIMIGHSFRTEGVSPLNFCYMDGKYIATVHKQFGKLPMKTYPNLWMTSFLKYMMVNQVKRIRPLYYMDYIKEDVKQFLTDNLDWQWYGGHHLENRFTAFVHSYWFPRRFGIDQRLNGYSAMVRTGQMSREEGLARIRQAPECDPELLAYVKKRLGYSDADFDRLLNLPIKTYKDFKTYKQTFERMRWFFWLMLKANLVPESFYMKFTVKDDWRHDQMMRDFRAKQLYREQMVAYS